MKKFSSIVILFYILFGCCLGLCAQQSVNAGGGLAVGITGNGNYSVGQLVYTTNTGSTASMAQGVQQPYEISVVLGIDYKEIQIQAYAFPNPTVDYLTLRLTNIEATGLKYQMTDLSGRHVMSKRLTHEETQIPMYHLASATYFISVTKNRNILKTFKVIKE